MRKIILNYPVIRVLNHAAHRSKTLVVETSVALSVIQRRRVLFLPVAFAPNKVIKYFSRNDIFWSNLIFSDAADQMISLAKTLDNNAKLITLAQIFAQQPRESENSQATLYCQQAPENTELDGFYPCQFEGVNQDTFTGNIAVGGAGTIPYGLTAAVNPAGSWYVSYLP
jgi:hypothetical protein